MNWIQMRCHKEVLVNDASRPLLKLPATTSIGKKWEQRETQWNRSGPCKLQIRLGEMNGDRSTSSKKWWNEWLTRLYIIRWKIFYYYYSYFFLSVSSIIVRVICEKYTRVKQIYIFHMIGMYGIIIHIYVHECSTTKTIRVPTTSSSSSSSHNIIIITCLQALSSSFFSFPILKHTLNSWNST